MAVEDDLEAHRLRTLMAMNKKDEVGRTPLHLAAQYNRRDVAEAMIREQGANMCAKDNRGRHPAHTAAMENGADVIQMLFSDEFTEPDQMADIEAQDEKGWTALHLAARLDPFFLRLFLLLLCVSMCCRCSCIAGVVGRSAHVVSAMLGMATLNASRS